MSRDTILEVEHRPEGEIVLRFKSPRFRRLPDTTKQHLVAAQKEILLALRDILDRVVERKGKSGAAPKRKRTKIKVE